MPCINDRERSAADGRSTAILAGPVLRCATLAPRGSNTRSSILVRTKRSSRASSDSARNFFIRLLPPARTHCSCRGRLHAPLPCGRCAVVSKATGACDATRRHVQRLQLLVSARGPLSFLRSVDQRLQQHLAVAPGLELVLQDEGEG